MILQALKRGRVNFSYLIVIHVWTDALNRIKYIAAWSYVLISEITPLQANLISIRYLYAEIIFPYDMGKLGKSFWIVPKYDELLNYVVSFDYDNSHFLSISLSLSLPPPHTHFLFLPYILCMLHTYFQTWNYQYFWCSDKSYDAFVFARSNRFHRMYLCLAHALWRLRKLRGRAALVCAFVSFLRSNAVSIFAPLFVDSVIYLRTSRRLPNQSESNDLTFPRRTGDRDTRNFDLSFASRASLTRNNVHLFSGSFCSLGFRSFIRGFCFSRTDCYSVIRKQSRWLRSIRSVNQLYV